MKVNERAVAEASKVIEQGRWKHFSFGQANYSGGVIRQRWTGKWTGMVEWTMEWTMEFIKKQTFFTVIDTQLYCVAISLLTYS